MKLIPSLNKLLLRPLLVAGLTAALLGVTATTSDAAVDLKDSNLASKVSGSTVDASVKVSAASTTTVDSIKICVRDQSGRNLDFWGSLNAQITTDGTWISRSRSFAAGTYTYWACARDGGVWWDGSKRTFTVGSASLTAPSGTAMPVGDLPGWKQVFKDDFTSTVPRGSFPGPYAGRWMSYDGFTDTSKVGDYDQSIISAQNGVLDLHLHAVNGRPRGAAPIPLVNGRWGGQTYGRFSVRMKSDSIRGYGTGFLLWPDSNDPNQGEIDFPESGLHDVVKGYNHCLGEAARNCLVTNTTYRYTDWHTYTIDWKPGKLTFAVDGVVVGSTTVHVPRERLHWVMQVATIGNAEAALANSGHLLIDWATIYTYNP